MAMRDWMTTRWAALAWLMPCLGAGAPAAAATIRVPADYPTINQGLDAASFGDTVLVGPGVHESFETRDGITSAAFLKDGVALVSEDGPEVTTIRMVYGGSNSSVLVALSLQSEETVVDGFTVTGQAPFAAGLAAGGCERVTLKSCHFVDLDNGLQGGGGIYSYDSGVHAIDCLFLRCVTTADAAGIQSVDGDLIVDSCVFEDCVGGAIRAFGSTFVFSGGSVTNSVFRNNVGIGGGGALVLTSKPTFSVEGCLFEGNTTPSQSGRALVAAAAFVTTLYVRENVFVGNVAGPGGFGGGVFWNTPRGELTNNTFYRNHADPGHGSACWIRSYGFMTVSNNVYVQNTGAAALSIDLVVGEQPMAGCQLFWDNPGGDTEDYEVQPTDLFVDPEFCDGENGDFTVSATSPCLPENSSGCGLIGAFGEGCGVISVEDASWAEIKARYR
jgi:hypothetical protein